MPEPSTAADGTLTPPVAPPDDAPGAMPADGFSLTAPITLQDRIAAALFSYADMFGAARRRALYFLTWVVLALLGMLGFFPGGIAASRASAHSSRASFTTCSGWTACPSWSWPSRC